MITEHNKFDYYKAIGELSRGTIDTDAQSLLESLVDNYFSMLEHLKKTSLLDVLTYEDRLARGTLEPLKILQNDNDRLRKEVNKLRKQLGLVEKYKET